jgi:hypothetical protein
VGMARIRLPFPDLGATAVRSSYLPCYFFSAPAAQTIGPPPEQRMVRAMVR